MRAPWATALVLAALLPAALAAQPTTRKVWSDESTNLLGAPSPNGRFLSFVDPAAGDLALYELASGGRRLLTHQDGDADTFAYFSAVSADSRRVAYAWFNEEGFYELRVIDAAGGEPRRLYSNAETGFVQPCDWSPDGEHILTLFFRKDNVSQIALVSARDGSSRVVKTLNWFYPKKISFSTDGRFILYDSLSSRGSAARDILLLRTDGSGEHKLVEHEANDIFPQWTPDGRHIVFASDRLGEMDLWLLAVEGEQAVGEPRRIARSLGRALPLGVTRDGVYYYGLRAGRADIFTAALDLKAETMGEPQPAGLRTVGRGTAPAWSPDSTRLAYLTQLGTENYGKQSRGVTLWRPDTREERVLTPELAYLSRLDWAPDGSSLLAAGSDGRGRSGLFRLDAETGDTTPLLHEAGGDPGGFEGVWGRADATVYFVFVAPQQNGGDAIRRLQVADRSQQEVRSPVADERVSGLRRSPDGAWLAFLVEREDGRIFLQALRVETGEERRLMSLGQAGAAGVDWTPGSEALWVGVRAGEAAQLWRVPLEGKTQRSRIAIPADASMRIAPDGKSIAYSVSDERSEVWALEGWLPESR